MARLLAVMHRDQEAVELLLQARDLEPDNSDPYTVLSLLYRRPMIRKLSQPTSMLAASSERQLRNWNHSIVPTGPAEQRRLNKSSASCGPS